MEDVGLAPGRNHRRKSGMEKQKKGLTSGVKIRKSAEQASKQST